MVTKQLVFYKVCLTLIINYALDINSWRTDGALPGNKSRQKRNFPTIVFRKFPERLKELLGT